jgi:hypothetical protein
MAIVNRGFQGRRRQPGAGLIPPGQYVVEDFPVLSAGPPLILAQPLASLVAEREDE